jgi:hypothetical protein
MKKILSTCLVLLVVLLWSGQQQPEKKKAEVKKTMTIEQLWREVNKAKKDGLPKSAIAKLEQILGHARSRCCRLYWPVGSSIISIIIAGASCSAAAPKD